MKKIHRFFLKEKITAGEMTVLNTEVVHQLYSVLKLRPGEKIIVSNGDGYEAEAEIISADKRRLSILVGALKKGKTEPDRKVILYSAILKKEHLELAVRQATEAGVAAIVPVVTERTVKTDFNAKRLEKITQEAAEQAERAVLPAVNAAVKFDSALKLCEKNDLNIFFVRDGARPSEAVKKIRPGAAVGVFVGPEGGWTEAEETAAMEAGLVPASLGDTILRGETAAAIGVWLASGAI